MEQSGANTIGADDLAAAAHRRRQGLLAGIGGAAVAVVTFVGALAGLQAGVASVVITGGVLASAFGIAWFVDAGQVLAIGATSAWRLEQVEVSSRGTGRNHRIVLQLTGCRWHHEPWGTFSNTSTLQDHTQLEVAGDPGQRVLVRIPGDHKVRIFRPVHR
ncbi:hypothetical protein B7486_69835 [cyanobacterium TDX16]|nr:hypothetical protein B7486_69835 [cyanobacterium TDX16]